MGMIDTLSAGFDRTAKRLWLILLPVLLDIGIWVGPKLSLGRLAREVILLLPDAAELGDQYTVTIEMMRRWLTDAGATTNVMAMLSMRMLGLPSLADTLAPQALPFGIVQRSIEIPTWSAFVGVALLFTLISLLIGCFCLSFIAQDARYGETSPVLAGRCGLAQLLARRSSGPAQLTARRSSGPAQLTAGWTQ